MDDVGLWLTVFVEFLVLHQTLNFASGRYTDTIATVGVFSRFNNPYSFLFLQLFSVKLLDSLVFFFTWDDVIGVREISEWVNLQYI